VRAHTPYTTDRQFISCARGDDETQQQQRSSATQQPAIVYNIYFRDYHSPFIANNISQLCICISYIVYVALAIHGCVTMRQGLQIQNLVPYDTNTYASHEVDGQMELIRRGGEEVSGRVGHYIQRASPAAHPPWVHECV
jgi:hypothetical protein